MPQNLIQVLILTTTSFLSGSFILSWNQKRWKEERQGENFTTFMDYFLGEEIPENICFQIYTYLQSVDINLQDFPIRPTDDLGTVYGICEEDLDEAVLEIARRCDCPMTNISNMRAIKTVEDLVRLMVNLQIRD
jgi:hypothetical protein